MESCAPGLTEAGIFFFPIIEKLYPPVCYLYVSVSLIIHKFCDDHLFGQVNKIIGRYQLPILQT